MRTGVLGGTFDPPHVGHLILAAEACDQLGLDRVLWVLTATPPHKEGWNVRPWEQRYEMLQAALNNNPRFVISRIDIDRPGPYYAVDTVRLLRAASPQDELYYLMGGDSLHDLPVWHDPGGFLAAIDGLGVMRRPGDAIDLSRLEGELPGITHKIRFIDAPLLEISSRQIRQRIVSGHAFRYYLPASVYRMIVENDWYRPETQA
jgi:nicotinate-nucleotide adenylyltransferase